MLELYWMTLKLLMQVSTMIMSLVLSVATQVDRVVKSMELLPSARGAWSLSQEVMLQLY